ncbi:MAG: hypothetical protein ACMG6E_05080 [Candidatus Roizmanbacteria bacterium]
MAKRMNEHLESIGSHRKILPSAQQVEVTNEEIKAKECGKNGCKNPATHLSSFVLKEMLICDEHTAVFMTKNGKLPTELWFCKKL